MHRRAFVAVFSSGAVDECDGRLRRVRAGERVRVGGREPGVVPGVWHDVAVGGDAAGARWVPVGVGVGVGGKRVLTEITEVVEVQENCCAASRLNRPPRECSSPACCCARPPSAR